MAGLLQSYRHSECTPLSVCVLTLLSLSYKSNTIINMPLKPSLMPRMCVVCVCTYVVCVCVCACVCVCVCVCVRMSYVCVCLDFVAGCRSHYNLFLSFSSHPLTYTPPTHTAPMLPPPSLGNLPPPPFHGARPLETITWPQQWPPCLE